MGLTPEDPDDDRPRRVSRFESAVETLHALGAISAADAERWRHRFEAARAEPEDERPVPDGDTRERVTRFITALFDEKRAGKGEERALSFRRSVFALEGVGAISLEEAYRWIDRISLEFGLPTRKEEDERGRAATCTALDLRRVVVAPTTVGGLEITHLELYSDGALLYSRETGPHGRGSVTCGAKPVNPFSKDRKKEPLTVTDDVGTAYEPEHYHGYARSLTPAVPDAASRLTLSYADAVGEIPLR